MKHKAHLVKEEIMPRGESGRIVIEVSPELKRQLYSALALKNQTLKGWFIEAAEQYLVEAKQAANLKQEVETSARKDL